MWNLFGILCGIYLEDNIDINSGNFTVFPGSHHTVRAFAKDHDLEKEGIGELRKYIRERHEPFQITVKKGTMVVAHRLLFHSTNLNNSDIMRKVIWFRPQVENQPTYKEVIQNPFDIYDLEGTETDLSDTDDSLIPDLELEKSGMGYQTDKNTFRIRVGKEPCLFASMGTLTVCRRPMKVDFHSFGFISKFAHTKFGVELTDTFWKDKNLMKMIRERLYHMDYNQLIKSWYPNYNINKIHRIKTVKITLHHIKSRSKSGLMNQWFNELNLQGSILKGSPGIISVSGDRALVDLFVNRFRCFHWNKVPQIREIN